MKKILPLQTILMLAFLLNAQAQSAMVDLDINNVRARLLNCGDMFWNPSSGLASYEFPKGSGKTSAFASALWISGMDSISGNLHVAAQSFRQRGHDYWPGPIGNGSVVDTLAASKWDRFWKINLSDINSFRAIYAGITSTATIQAAIIGASGSIAPIIKEWPAKGNTNTLDAFGNPLPINIDMAPFVDINNDGIYDWRKGDYPAIKGHQAVWWVFNDQRTHYNSGSNALGIEVKAMAYACATNDALNNMTFYDFKLKNTSSTTYLNTRVAEFIDIDLGAGFDDYIGFDTIRRMAIGYNGDNFDDVSYEYDLTQTACILLKTPTDIGNFIKPLGANSFFNNGSVGPQVDPTSPIEFRNHMLGKWNNGAPFRNSCDGIDTSGAVVNFLYPSDPSELSGFSEKNCNNQPSDRRGILSSSSFTFHPNDIVEFNIAYINTPVGSNNINFNLIKAYGDTAIAHQNGCGINNSLSINSIAVNNQISIYPNPTSQFVTIAWKTLPIESIEMINLVGQSMFTKASIGQSSVQIDVSNYPKGIYTIKLTQKEQVYLQKIVIE